MSRLLHLALLTLLCHCTTAATTTLQHYTVAHNNLTFTVTPSGVDVTSQLSSTLLGTIPLNDIISVVPDGSRLYVLCTEIVHVYEVAPEKVPVKLTVYSEWGRDPVGMAVGGDCLVIAMVGVVKKIDIIEGRGMISAAVNNATNIVSSQGIAIVSTWGGVVLFTLSTLEQLTVLSPGLLSVLALDPADDQLYFTADPTGNIYGYNTGPPTIVFNYVVPRDGDGAIHPTSLSYSSTHSLVYFAYRRDVGSGVVWRVDVENGECRVLYVAEGDVVSVSRVNESGVVLCSGSAGCFEKSDVDFRPYSEVVGDDVPASVNDDVFFEKYSKELAGGTGLVLTVAFVVYIRFLLRKPDGPPRDRDPHTPRPIIYCEEQDSIHPSLPPQPYGEDIPAPEHMICPISLEIMVEPVKCIDGYHSFEKYHMERFLKNGKGECPVSRQAMKVDDLTPDTQLKEEILAWVQRYREKLDKCGAAENVSLPNDTDAETTTTTSRCCDCTGLNVNSNDMV